MMKTIFSLIILISLQVLNAQSLEEVDVSGGTLKYVTQGEGDVIVYIHGLQEDFSVFMPQVELLSGEYQVVTYSRRYNYPNKNQITGEFNTKTEGQDLKNLIEKIGKPVTLVGHSYGGLIALQFTLDYPDLVTNLIISEPSLVNWLPSLPDCPITLQDVRDNLIIKTKDAFQTGDTTKIMKSLFEFFAGEDIQDKVPPFILNSLKANLKEVEALVGSSAAFDAPDPDSIQKIHKPVMIITSEKTITLLKCTNKKLLDTLSGAVHHHLNDHGHEMWITASDLLASHVATFLRKQ